MRPRSPPDSRRPSPRSGGGVVSDYKVKIIAAQTADLSEEDVAKADVLLAAAGQVKNPAGLRDFARRQVARLDPGAASRKKARGLRNAHVRTWQEDSGNMGLAAREMPGRGRADRVAEHRAACPGRRTLANIAGGVATAAPPLATRTTPGLEDGGITCECIHNPPCPR